MTSTPTPTPASEPTTQQRLAWMGQNSKKLILALIALIIAAAVVVFSFSLFTSSSANPGNLVASGSLKINNNLEGAAILTATGLLPGESTDGTVALTNVGDSAGVFTLKKDNVVNTPASPAFSSVLTLIITEGGAEIYNGRIDAMPTRDLGTWEPGESHTYKFTVTFDETAGDEFQDGRTTLDFLWDATQA
jgi:hypothetical protein